MYEPRRAPAGIVYGYTDLEGNQVELAAEQFEGADDAEDPAGDESGYWFVRPRNLVEVALLDGHDAPVARKVLALDRAAAEADEARKSRKKFVEPDVPAPGDTPVSDGGPA